MAEPAEVLTADRSRTDDMGWSHVRLKQTYKGIHVEGTHIAMHFDDERVPRIVNYSHFVPDLNLSTTALVDGPTAVTTALQGFGVVSASGPETKELVIYEHNGAVHLAWKVSMFVADPLGYFIYFIDARTGVVVDSYNNIHSAKNRQIYDNLNTTNTLPGTLRRSEGGGVYGDTAVDQTSIHSGAVYDYFAVLTPARDGIDDLGSAMVSTVHYDVALNNAFWNGSLEQMVYGNGDGVTFSNLAEDADVVAHELVHGIT